MVNPRSKHATRHKFLLKRLIKCLRSAWGMIIEMEPTAHLSYSNPKQPDVAAANIGRRHRRLVADLKLTSSLASKGKDAAGDGELGWKGAYVRFGNTEPGLLNLVKGRGKYSPSGATAAAVAEEEDEEEEAEAEEVGEGEDADAPKGPLKQLLPKKVEALADQRRCRLDAATASSSPPAAPSSPWARARTAAWATERTPVGPAAAQEDRGVVAGAVRSEKAQR